MGMTSALTESKPLAPEARSLLVRLVEERDEQLLALAISICGQLSAPGADRQDSSHHTALRLAQLMESELSSTTYRNVIRGLVA